MNKLTCAAVSTVFAAGAVIAAAPPSEAATSIRAEALKIAAKQEGDPYKSGAEGPSKFDCSGLVDFAYRKAGYRWPSRLNAQDQYNLSKKISKSSRKPGDLVFFGGRNSIVHVGIYAGNGKIWHSPRPGKRVEKVKLWTKSVHYGRISN